jgi:hypothetical protein
MLRAAACTITAPRLHFATQGVTNERPHLTSAARGGLVARLVANAQEISIERLLAALRRTAPHYEAVVRARVCISATDGLAAGRMCGGLRRCGGQPSPARCPTAQLASRGPCARERVAMLDVFLSSSATHELGWDTPPNREASACVSGAGLAPNCTRNSSSSC